MDFSSTITLFSTIRSALKPMSILTSSKKTGTGVCLVTYSPRLVKQ